VEPLKISFGRRLQAIRESKGISREFIAQNADYDATSLYRVEKGLQWIAPDTLQSVAKILDVSPAVFFTDDVVKIEPTVKEALEIITRHIEGASLSKLDPLAELVKDPKIYAAALEAAQSEKRVREKMAAEDEKIKKKV
jgi:transcriptional regulator with XRE-family HTH domain